MKRQGEKFSTTTIYTISYIGVGVAILFVAPSLLLLISKFILLLLLFPIIMLTVVVSHVYPIKFISILWLGHHHQYLSFWVNLSLIFYIHQYSMLSITSKYLSGGIFLYCLDVHSFNNVCYLTLNLVAVQRFWISLA